MDGGAAPSRIDSAVSAALILFVLAGTYLAAYGVSTLVEIEAGRSWSFDLPIPVRALGLVLLAIAGWSVTSVFRVREVSEVWNSTSVTFLKLVRRRPLDERSGRTEPFVPVGPYRYVRSPMYLGIVVGVWGLGVALSSIPLLLWGLMLAGWYWFYLIPFEEKELEALFGETYVRYRRQVPKLFPNGRRYRGEGTDG